MGVGAQGWRSLSEIEKRPIGEWASSLVSTISQDELVYTFTNPSRMA